MTLQLQTHLTGAGGLPAAADARECVLGGSVLGRTPGAAADWPVQIVNAPLLGSSAAWLGEVWRCAGGFTSGEAQGVAWRRAAGVLFGVIEIDEQEFAATTAATALEAATQEAYLRIFRLLDAQGMPHLWRAWNYLADINRESAGLERYRQFNIGRQNAFLASRRSAAGSVPAACAIGLAGGPLSIAFLAGAKPVVAVENPRQVSAYDYPADYGPRSPTFSRAVLAYPPGQEVLFVSGTASIVGHRTVYPGDIEGQCRETLANLAAVVGEAGKLARSRPFELEGMAYRVYVRNAADFPQVRKALAAALPGGPGIVYLQADICRSDLLLEIEAAASHTLGEKR